MQGTWLKELRSLKFFNLRTSAGHLTAGHLTFDLRGLPATVREVQVHAAELSGALSGDQRLRTLECGSGRALKLTVEPPSEGVTGRGSSERVPSLQTCT